MTFRDNFNRPLPALKRISIWPIEVMDADFIRTATNAEWEAAMCAKYGDDWQDEPTDADLALAGDDA